jgi:hypothetical protein
VQAVATRPRDQAFMVGLGAFLVAIAAVPALLLFGQTTYDVWGGLLVAPLLVAISVPALRRQAEREADDRLFPVFAAALALKLVGAVARYFVAFSVYAGVADASAYDAWGRKLATAFWHGHFRTRLPSLSGTDFMRFLTGLVYSVVGPTKLGGFLVFSWLGFWGLFLFYRAFTIGVLEGRRRTYAALVFFLPSLVFWPSSIGKEAWMMFSIGIAAFGVAKILTGQTFRGLIPFGIGLWFAAIVRPHVAGMIAVALVAGYLLKRPHPSLRQLAPIVKTVVLTGLIVLAGILVVRTDRFLHGFAQGPNPGVTDILQGVTERTQQGGSSFAPSVLESPLRTPVAAVTVLYRPLLVDATNVQSLIAATEGTILLIFSIVRIRWILAALFGVRRQPYVGFAIAYTAVFILGFSAIANFGLLARERVQVLPFFLVLLAVPPAELREPEKETETTEVMYVP